MQLSLIRKDKPSEIEGDNTIWINTNNNSLYTGAERIIPNYQSMDSPARVGDVISELKKRSWLTTERKYIDIHGNLVLNTEDTNIKSISPSGEISYKECITYSEDFGKIKGYEKEEVYLLNLDTSLNCINFLDNSEQLQVVFPEDNVCKVDLSMLASKNIIPGLYCYLTSIQIGYWQHTSEGVWYRTINTDASTISEEGNRTYPALFYYTSIDGKIQKIINSTLSSQTIQDSTQRIKFCLDFTEDEILSLHALSGFEDVVDYKIVSCYVKFKLSGRTY